MPAAARFHKRAPTRANTALVQYRRENALAALYRAVNNSVIDSENNAIPDQGCPGGHDPARIAVE
jgi:hypothetical protein